MSVMSAERAEEDVGSGLPMTRARKKVELRVPYALAVHGAAERRAVLKVLDEKKTILGPCTRRFEQKVATLLGMEHGVMVNSGSSANLLAVEALGLPAGAEVITPVLTFSTTVAPLLQKLLVPAFIDAEISTYLIDVRKIEEQIGERTKVVMVPLLLGNVPKLDELRALADKHDLRLILDSCDTIGAHYDGRPVGEFADIVTTSFYGSHIITCAGGGGMVCTNDPQLARDLKVLRGWGRRSSGLDESEEIGKRFGENVDGVPYDAKFVFDSVGYNFLPLEISAAFGEAQLRRLPAFARARKEAFGRLRDFFEGYVDFFVLPEQLAKVKTNWLAFPLTIRREAPFNRLQLITHLEDAGIQTRVLFAGNLLRHAGFRGVKSRLARDGYPVADCVMRNSLVIGCHQGLTDAHFRHIESTFQSFLAGF